MRNYVFFFCCSFRYFWKSCTNSIFIHIAYLHSKLLFIAYSYCAPHASAALSLANKRKHMYASMRNVYCAIVITAKGAFFRGTCVSISSLDCGRCVYVCALLIYRKILSFDSAPIHHHHRTYGTFELFIFFL